MGIRDVLLVPPDVRKSLGAALPPAEYTVYGLSWHHAGAVTSRDDQPYELYLPYSTARNRPEVLRALAESKAGARTDLVSMLPKEADPELPVCRDVWTMSRGRPWRQCALDIVFGTTTSFPLVANVFLFSEQDVLVRNFTAPVSIELNVPMRFDK